MEARGLEAYPPEIRHEMNELYDEILEEGGYMSEKNPGLTISAAMHDFYAIHRMEVLRWIESEKDSNPFTSFYAANFAMDAKGLTILEAIDKFSGFMKSDFGAECERVACYDGSSCAIFFGKAAFCLTQSTPDFSIYAVGSREIVEKIRGRFGKDETKIRLNWWYPSGSGDFDSCDIDFPATDLPKDIFYPFLPVPLKTYYQDFMSSKAPILLLIGAPGTGKTSFIRGLIKDYNLNNTMVAYDSSVVRADYFYVQFMTNPKHKLMVIEDADDLLSERSDGNATMKKLLNVSQGLVELVGKKIIFTTNLDNINYVDDAIIRPGRCFDVVDFRTLSLDEANAISAVEGLEPLTGEKSTYTLADIFNRRKFSYYSKKVGFRP